MKHTYSHYKKLYKLAFIPLLTSAILYGMEEAEVPPVSLPSQSSKMQNKVAFITGSAQVRHPNGTFWILEIDANRTFCCKDIEYEEPIPKRNRFYLLVPTNAAIAGILAIVKGFHPESIPLNADYIITYASISCAILMASVIYNCISSPYRECTVSAKESRYWRDTASRREKMMAAIKAQDVDSFLSNTNDTVTFDPSHILYDDNTSIFELAIQNHKEGMDPDARIIDDLFNRWRAFHPQIDQTTIRTILSTPETDADSQNAYLIRLIARNRNLQDKILDPFIHPHKRRSQPRRAIFPVSTNAEEEEEEESIPLLDFASPETEGS